jgi:hypothetical protein
MKASEWPFEHIHSLERWNGNFVEFKVGQMCEESMFLVGFVEQLPLRCIATFCEALYSAFQWDQSPPVSLVLKNMCTVQDLWKFRAVHFKKEECTQVTKKIYKFLASTGEYLTSPWTF